jgi:hypothetical protein
MQMTGDRHVVEAGDGNVARDVQAPSRKRVDDAESSLVVRAHDRSGKVLTSLEQ